MAKSKPKKPAASLSSSLLEKGDFRSGASALRDGEASMPSGERPKRRASTRKSGVGGSRASTHEAAGGPESSQAVADDKRPVESGKPSAQIRFLFQDDAGADGQGSGDSDSATAQFLEELRRGRFAEAEVIFGRITALEPKAVKKILYGKKFETLALACRASGFKPLEFTTILAILRGAKGDHRLVNYDSLRDSLDFFNRVDRDDALKILANLPRP